MENETIQRQHQSLNYSNVSASDTNIIANEKSNQKPQGKILTCPHCQKKGLAKNKARHLESCLKNVEKLKEQASNPKSEVFKCPLCLKELSKDQKRRHLKQCGKKQHKSLSKEIFAPPSLMQSISLQDEQQTTKIVESHPQDKEKERLLNLVSAAQVKPIFQAFSKPKPKQIKLVGRKRDLKLLDKITDAKQDSGEQVYIYSCEICQKAFSLESNLLVHQRIHLPVKPFVCHVCPLTFASKGNLNDHLRRHFNQRPHKCKLCRASFYRCQKLKRHLMNKHQQDSNVQIQPQMMSDYFKLSFDFSSYTNVKQNRQQITQDKGFEYLRLDFMKYLMSHTCQNL